MAQASLHEWPYGRIPFVLRDDDVCYFTDPKMIDRVYSEAWNLGYPVSLSAIPKCSADIPFDDVYYGKKLKYDPLIPAKFRGRKESLPIYENEKLCSILRKLSDEGKVSVMQHGLTHGRINGKAEFEHPDRSFLTSRIVEGKRTLKKAGFRPEVFVAPFEKLSSSGWKAISSQYEFAYTVGRVHITPLYPLPFYTVSPLRFLREWRTGRARSHFLSFYRGLLILRSWGSFFDLEKEPAESLSHAKQKLSNDIDNQKPCIWYSHYWEWFFDWSDELVYKDHLVKRNRFLKHALSLPIWPTTVIEMMKWRKSFCGLRVNHTRRGLVILATEAVPSGLTILGRGRVHAGTPAIEQGDQRIVLGNIAEGERIVVEMY